MLRLLGGLILFVGILVIPVHGIGFAPVEDVSPTRLLGEILWLDADGNGITDVVALDVHRQKLVARLRYPGTGNVPSVTDPLNFIDLGGPAGDPSFFPIGKADLNADGFDDVYAQTEREIHWWAGASDGISYRGIWHSFERHGAILEIIVDIDADGSLDIILGGYPDSSFVTQPKPSLIGFGDGAGGFSWVEYPPVMGEFRSSLAGARTTVDLEGDAYPDLLADDGYIRFIGREMVEVIPRDHLITTRIPEISHDVFIKSNPGDANTPGEFFLVKFVPGTGWVQIGERTQAFDLYDNPARGFRHLSVVGGAFDNIRVTCAAIVVEFTDSTLPRTVYPVVFLIKFEDSRLKVSSSIYSPGLQGRYYSRSTRTPGEPDLLVRHSFITEAFDLFGNAVGISSGLTEGIVLSPQFRFYSISTFHETRSLAFVQVQPNMAASFLSAGGRDRSIVAWTDGFAGSIPSSQPIAEPAISIMAGGQSVPGTTDIFFSTVSGMPATNGQSFTFQEAREQTLSSQNSWAIDSSGFFPQHLIGVSDLDLDGTMDILYVDPTNGALVSRQAFVESGTGGSAPGIKRFISPAVVPFKWDKPRAQTSDNTVLYDIDGDGDDDILRFPSIYGHRIGLHWNDDGNFSRSQPIGMEIEGFPQGIFIGKFTGTEIEIGVVGASEDPESYDAFSNVVSFASSLVIFSIQGGLLQQFALPPFTEKVVPGDLNGDGLDDLVVDTGGISSDLFGNPVSNEGFSILRNTGAGFSEPIALGVPHDPIVSILVEDIDSDGLDDLVLGDKHGRIMYFRSLPVEYASENYAAWALRLNASSDGKGDADGDGDPDLIEYLSGSDPHVSGDTGPHGIRPKMGIELDIYDAVSALEDGSKPFVGNVLSSMNFAIRTDRGADKVRIGIERSSNLTDWELIEDLGNGFLLPGQAGWSLIERNEIRLGNARKEGDFYRIRAELIEE